VLLISNIIVFLDEEKRFVIGNIFVASSAIILQMSLSLKDVYRQNLDGLIGKKYAFIAIGLMLLCIAEILCTYSKIGLGIKNRFRSISNIFWLAGYAPLIYYIIKMHKLFDCVHKSNTILVCINLQFIFGFVIYF
jgi:hypothetical protein